MERPSENWKFTVNRMLTALAILMVCAFGQAAIAAEVARTKGLDPVMTHREAIKTYRERAGILKAKIIKVSGFIVTAENNTYRDPKKLKRGHWQRLVGAWQRQLNDATQQIAWHTTQLTALQASGD